jgi:hypothetical protein
MFLNMISSSGQSGCLKCLHTGQSVPYGNGHHVIYCPYLILWKPFRNKKNYNQCLSESLKTNKSVYGVKGFSSLTELIFFDIIKSTNIDIMHSIFLGVVKLMFVYWFNSKLEKPYCMKQHIGILNGRLLSCRPPNSVAQAPRKLEDFNNWRAHEFMHFILFFAIPVFYKIMPTTYFDHLLLLIISLEKLLNKKINRNELGEINSMLNKFVVEADDLYGSDIMTSGMHELGHLVECTKELGNLNGVCCFAFEELNRKITRTIKGSDLIGDEFLKIWGVSLHLSYRVNELKDENQFVSFIKEYFSIKSSNLKYSHDKVVLKLGNKIEVDLNKLSLQIKKILFSLVNENEFSFYEKVFINKVVYTIENDQTKFNNSVIKFEEEIGIIDSICKSNDDIFLICRRLKLNDSPFYNVNFKSINSSFSFFYVTNNFFIVMHHTVII